MPSDAPPGLTSELHMATDGKGECSQPSWLANTGIKATIPEKSD